MSVATGLPEPADRPEPSLDRLRDLAADGSFAVLPVRLFEPGHVLLLPFGQIIHVQSPPHAHGDIQVQIANSIAWVHFTPESWAPVLIPDDPWKDCDSCGHTWIGGCDPGCVERIISEDDTASALAAAELTGRWSATEILEATS
jgi:hypothetical protein